MAANQNDRSLGEGTDLPDSKESLRERQWAPHPTGSSPELQPTDLGGFASAAKALEEGRSEAVEGADGGQPNHLPKKQL